MTSVVPLSCVPHFDYGSAGGIPPERVSAPIVVGCIGTLVHWSDMRRSGLCDLKNVKVCVHATLVAEQLYRQMACLTVALRWVTMHSRVRLSRQLFIIDEADEVVGGKRLDLMTLKRCVWGRGRGREGRRMMPCSCRLSWIALEERWC